MEGCPAPSRSWPVAISPASKIEAESWVTVKGGFEAEGDSTATTIARAK